MNGANYNKALSLTAAAIAAWAVPASAEVYLTESQALGAVLGDKTALRREQKTLDPSLRKRLEEASGLRFPETSVTFFIAAQDGKAAKYAVVMNEIGKSEPITFMVGMSPEGKVSEVVIMEFRENRGWEVKEKRFLNQFRGKTAKSAIRVDEDIINYTGATLSSKAVARGVKRALLLLDALYPGEARYKLGAARDFALPGELKPIAMTATTAGPIGLYRQTRYAMGTHCEICAWCFDASEARSLFGKGFQELERIEQIFSAYREDSELSQVNRKAVDAYTSVSHEFLEMAQIATQAASQTNGAVNFAVGPLDDLWRRCESEERWPTRNEIEQARTLSDPSKISLNGTNNSIQFLVSGIRLDFGGIAKGYAAEKVGRVLEESGAVSALVNLGRSSIYATNVNVGFALSEGRDTFSGRVDRWPLAILKPSNKSGVEGIEEILLLAPGEAVSTSGTTERGFVIQGERLSHILNPITGAPVRGVRSATVIGRDGIQTEVASKALLLVQNPLRTLARDELSYWICLEGDAD